MRSLVVAAALLFAGCVGDSSSSFRIVVDDQAIEITAPTTVIVQTFVIDAPGDVTISSPALPGFAMISGESIVLSPMVEDAGDYAIPLVATSGGETAHATLKLHIVGMNTGPMWLAVPFFSDGSPATIRAPVCDKEHDNFTFEVSVALISDPIPNTPMFTHFIDFTQIQPIINDQGWCADFITELPGLAPGMYHGSMHAVDVHGAEDPYGWVEVPSTFSVP